MTHPIIVAIIAVLAIYGGVFVSQIFAINRAKRRVRAAIQGDRALEAVVKNDPAEFLALCRIPEAKHAYMTLARGYAGLQKHMIGFFSLSAVLFLAVNLFGLSHEDYEALVPVDILFALALFLVLRVSGKISRFRETVHVESRINPDVADLDTRAEATA